MTNPTSDLANGERAIVLSCWLQSNDPDESARTLIHRNALRLVEVENTGSAPVALRLPTAPSPWGTDANVVVLVPPGQRRRIGPLPIDRFGDSASIAKTITEQGLTATMIAR